MHILTVFIATLTFVADQLHRVLPVYKNLTVLVQNQDLALHRLRYDEVAFAAVHQAFSQVFIDHFAILILLHALVIEVLLSDVGDF